ncbi:MAG: DUF1800 domain-containing protein [Planctomycetota bacterium]|jgi:uncharacterized protein (DUF1800 family)
MRPASLLLIALLSFAFLPSGLIERAPAQEPPAPGGKDAAPLDDLEQTWHALNRLAFGPRPGDVERVAAMGWRAWFEEQLDPSSIEDPAIDTLLAARFPSLSMDLAQLWKTYYPRYPEGFAELPEEQRDRLQQNRNRQYAKVQQELHTSVLLRAATSERQFQEVMVDFWRNHFNIDQKKGFCRLLANHYESSVIRAHAFGRFEEMLLASARHPAMSIYLDNEISQKPLTKEELAVLDQIREKRMRDPNAMLGMVAQRIDRHRGLNENYARELMELHTLGVDNFYEQNDVRELARILTGWSHGWLGDAYESEYGFRFYPEVHDADRKTVLGKRYKGSTEEEGILAIRRLASHPGTAEFISWKLCRYLVNDEPRRSLVAKGAEAFRESKGHLPTVYRAIVLSPEFIDRTAYRAKYRSPFEFVVGALRATGARFAKVDDIGRRLARMGQPLYQCEDPTGYFDQTEAWLDPGVLVHRWDFALQLTLGEVDGVRIDAKVFDRWAKGTIEENRSAIIGSIVPGTMPERTAALLARAKTPRELVGLILGTPEFQKQ